MNTKVTIQYDGSGYDGWQDQNGKNNTKTVEEKVKRAVSKINKEKTEIVASGRTDKGVSAFSQVFNFNNIHNIPLERLKNALNNALPKDIIVVNCEAVDADFHARFSAKSKEYHYYLNMGKYDMFSRNYVNQYNKQLNVEKMIEASKIFIGRHDFSAFNTTPKEIKYNQVITINKLDIEKNDDVLIFKIEGSSFLRHMVRMIVGSLVYVGSNKVSIERLEYLLNNPSDYRAPFNIEAAGLYLYKVNY